MVAQQHLVLVDTARYAKIITVIHDNGRFVGHGQLQALLKATIISTNTIITISSDQFDGKVVSS